jgi:hypothetical protein
MRGLALAALVALAACAGSDNKSPYDTRLLGKYPASRGAHVEAAGVVLGNKIWVITGTPGSSSNGCQCEDQALADTDIYDPSNDSWSSGPKVIHPRSNYPNAHVVGDTIYLLGGRPVDGVYNMEKLAPPYTQWVEIPDSAPPADANNRAGGVVDGKIVVLADGLQIGRGVAWAYDPATTKWTSRAQTPDSFATFTAGAFVGTKMPVFGGLVLGMSPQFRDVWLYDYAADRWDRIGTLPSNDKKFFESFAVSYHGRAMSLGADEDGRAVVEVDPESHLVSRFEDVLAEPRSDHVAGVVNDKIYLVGGIRPDTADVFVPTIEVRSR